MNFTQVRLMATFLFFLSGLAALMYQVTWQRLLVVFAGGDVGSITLIVSVFMIGLGLGNMAGGSVADRWTPRLNLLFFGVAELLIALFGFASKFLYYDQLYVGFGGVVDSPILMGLVLMAGLLLPTLLMGVSLPLLARATIHHLPDVAVCMGRLYGVNTLGAACGAVLVTWWLMPLYGLEGSINRAAAVNVFCALLVLPMVLWMPKPPTPKLKVADHSEVYPGEFSWSFRRCLFISALSGFIALALEMLWFRLLGVMLKSTAFTFGTLLAIYLFGVGLGSLAGIRLAVRCLHPGRLFLRLQFAVGMYAGLMTAAVLMTVHEWPLLRGIKTYLDSYEPVDANLAALWIQKWLEGTLLPEEAAMAWIFPAMHLGLPLLMIGPPTFLMGLGFPLLQKMAHADLGGVGRRVGLIQAANIFGCVLGTVCVGLWLLSALGTAATLRLLVFLCGVFGILALKQGGQKQPPVLLGISGVLFALAVVVLPEQRTFWARAHGTTVDRVYVAEDGAGVSLLKKPMEHEEGRLPTVVYVNGIGQSWIPYGGVHSLLGALPSLLHPRPEEIAIIGLGSADTLFSALSRYETREVVCMEIIGAQLETLRDHAAASGYAPLVQTLADPRVRHVMGDGRLHLMKTDQRFDIIEADALRPTSAHSGTLYSEEYFRLIGQRLKPGGYAVTWGPTQRVRETFLKVFPHVLMADQILLGSFENIDLTTTGWQSRLGHLEVRQHFRNAGIDVRSLVEPVLNEKSVVFGPEHDRSRIQDINTDVFPKDEFSLPALWGEGK